jgi:Tol biopolymer transport system component
MVMRGRFAALMSALLLVVASVAVYRFTHRQPHRFQLTLNSPLNPVTSGAISPDGRMLAYSDKEGVHLRDLASGNTQTVISANVADATVDWSVSAWFPDNVRFLVNAIAPDGKANLWIATGDGKARNFLEDASGRSVSPDGSWIVFTEHDVNADRDEIWLVNPNGENRHKPFETTGNNDLTRVQWSPDGKWLAYIKRPADPLEFSASLEIRGLNASPATVLLSNPALKDFFWLPDGRVVYSIQDGPGCSFAAIRIDAETGGRQGKPRKIARWTGACMQGPTVTASGDRISYTDGPIKSTVLTTDLDPAGMPVTTPKRLTVSEGVDSPDSWLPDNRTVIFQSTRTGEREIYRQADASEAPVQLTRGPGGKYWPRVTADGAWILYQILPHVLPKGSRVVTYAERRPLMRIPAAGGNPQLVVEEPLVLSHRCARHVDLCLVSQMNSEKNQLIFSSIDFSKGKGRGVARFPIEATGAYSWDISGDGSRIAIAKVGDPQIQIISLADDAVRSIPVRNWIRHQGLDWASDDKGLFIGTETPGGTALLYVDLQGEARTVWRQQGGLRSSGIQSADGRHLSLIGWIRQGNVWVMENP